MYSYSVALALYCSLPVHRGARKKPDLQRKLPNIVLGKSGKKKGVVVVRGNFWIFPAWRVRENFVEFLRLLGLVRSLLRRRCRVIRIEISLVLRGAQPSISVYDASREIYVPNQAKPGAPESSRVSSTRCDELWKAIYICWLIFYCCLLIFSLLLRFFPCFPDAFLICRMHELWILPLWRCQKNASTEKEKICFHCWNILRKFIELFKEGSNQSLSVSQNGWARSQEGYLWKLRGPTLNSFLRNFRGRAANI